MSKRDGGPAFPSGALDVAANKVASPIYDGMTLRDYLAGQALQGMLAGHASNVIKAGDAEDGASEVNATLAEIAYAIADAMLAQREADNAEGE